MIRHENLELVDEGKILVGAFAFINFKIDENKISESVRLAKKLIGNDLKNYKTTKFLKLLLNDALIRSMRGSEKNNLRKLFFDNISIPNIKYKEDFEEYLEEDNLFGVFKLITIAQILFKEYSPEEAAFLALYRYYNGFFSYAGVYKESQSRNSLNLPKNNSNENYGRFIKESPFSEFIDFVLSDKPLNSKFDGAPPIYKPYFPVFIAIRLLKQINKNKPYNKQIYKKINKEYINIEKTAKKLILNLDKNWLKVTKEIEKWQGWR